MQIYKDIHGVFGTHVVQITVQIDTYKADLITHLGGNSRGASILGSVINALESNDSMFTVTDENKRFLDFEESSLDKKHGYAKNLRLYNGDDYLSIDIGEDAGFPHRSVVKVEILEFIPEL